MNDVSSALRAAAIERAAYVLQAQRLRVLDRDWASGEHHLDLVATPGSDILAVAEVRIVVQGAAGACVATLTGTRFSQVADAVREWKRQRGALCSDLGSSWSRSTPSTAPRSSPGTPRRGSPE